MSATITSRGGILAKHSVMPGATIEIRVRRSGDTHLAHTGKGAHRISASSTNSAFYAALAVAEKKFGVGKARILGTDHQWGTLFRAVESPKGGRHE